MLNDILHQMEPMERYKYAQLLAHLASVDNTISKEELAFFEQRLGATLLSPERKQQLRDQLGKSLNLKKHLKTMNPRSIKLALRDICLMTMADREVETSEQIVLIKVARAAGLSEKHVEELLQWTIRGFHWMQEGYVALEI
ncbi:MAG TPA: hypothetical protein HA320_04525 [Candidatus Poseidoniaceae archaeon]|nr:hypothetical protein [Euryarchaeota archaeon]DAC53523.1 MAG TPA: hypothetical protein D7H78_04560 [Candidatus Poseidoniales archaeon]DAC69925.1 MAG TPA: hypothetical protein D7I16_03550 [Candidatus Poseidoniales archaeon]HII31306.1 hypothetical protein [Candidatus Poseidoniaceae archaeon]|tara:strand:+ start:2151 stop:2573 length:423 start_codon:yes stop_codon:yes gene_type:complete